MWSKESRAKYHKPYSERKEKIRAYNSNPKNVERKRSYELKKKFGLTLEDYDKLFEEQYGVCAICGKEEVALNKITKKTLFLAVDHNHQTGKVRGLLCGKCNTAIGKFEDSVELLQKAINYLNK